MGKLTVRQRITANLAQVKETTTGRLQEDLFDVPKTRVAQELHSLAHNPLSHIQHNGQVGRCSRYSWVGAK